MANAIRKKRSQKKLSPVQKVKGLIIKVGLAKKIKKRDGKLYFQPIWHRIAVVFVVLAVSGWFSLVTGAYLFVKHARHFPELKYFDLAFPHRWDDYRVSRGDYYIEQARERLQEGQFFAAVHLLRVGLSLSPDNVEGRIALSQLHTARGRPDLGIELLKDRVWEHTNDPTFLSALFSALFANHEDAVVDEIGTRILDGDLERTTRNSLVAYAVASANFNRGNYDRAEKYIADYRLYVSAPAMSLLAQILWEQGHRALAIQRLQDLITRTGGFDDAYRLLVQYQWSEGQPDRALQTAILHSSHDPLSFRPRLNLVRIHRLRDDHDRMEQNVDSFFRLYGGDPEAIQELAGFIGRNGPSSVAERLYQHAMEHEMDLQIPYLARIEAQVADGYPQRAIAAAQELAEAIDEWSPFNRLRFDAVMTAAFVLAGNTERADTHLASLLAARQRVPPAETLLLADRLEKAGDYNRCRQVLNHIRIHHPLHQDALTKLVRLDMKTRNNRDLLNNLNTLLTMRKPSAELLDDARRHIASDLFLFQSGRARILEAIETTIAAPGEPLASF